MAVMDEIKTFCIYDRNLFSAITRNIDNYFYQLEGYMMVDNSPYCASLDEAIADAEAIINLHNIERFDGGYFAIKPFFLKFWQ